MLQYNIAKHPITPAPGNFIARTVNVRSYTEDEIANQMLRRGTMLTKTDILAVMELRNTVIRDILAEGNAVNTALFNAHPSISGVFNGVSDSFDASRHHTHINLNPGKLLREVEKQIRPGKVNVAAPVPNITLVVDTVSGAINGKLTANGVIQVHGYRLRFFVDNPKNGLFLIGEDGTETRFNTIVENKPARLIAILPAGLQTGNYYLEVRTNFSPSGSREGKELKKGRFARMLTLQEL